MHMHKEHNGAAPAIKGMQHVFLYLLNVTCPKESHQMKASRHFKNI